jgi:phytoene dehydrogenase-like protein
MYDTIIIGAGMSGLAAGIRLAHFDQRVCILERHYTIGGLNSFYRLRGRNYDVGLHAITNFTPKGTRKGPLARLLRQLRFQWEDFALSPQIGSTIAFPGVSLNFDNDFEVLCAEIERAFPSQIDNFRQLVRRIIDYDDLDPETFSISAREIVSSVITDPLLVEMLFCPLMWYGNARENDMDFGQFSIMFRSIFMEGLARPFAGVRLILKKLVRRFRELGGELKLRAGVSRIQLENGQATGVILDNGTELTARRILSSAGWVETMRLCDHRYEGSDSQAGRMTFTEAMAILNVPPRALGYDRTILFFNDSAEFHWSPCDDLCDIRTGVICSPNNFLYGSFDDDQSDLPDGIIRITSIANFDRWVNLADDEYRVEKLRWYDRAIESAVRFMPDFRRHIIDHDMFSPKTIRRFTGHDNGAVYGTPAKHLDGRTPIKNLFVCGNDQGMVGIVGTLISGISMANQHCLREGPTSHAGTGMRFA